jgi:hypothetical protein
MLLSDNNFVKHKINADRDHKYYTAINRLKKGASQILVDIDTTARTICNYDECGIEIPGDNHDTLMPMIGQLKIHYRTIVKEYDDLCEAIKTLYELGNSEITENVDSAKE